MHRLTRRVLRGVGYAAACALAMAPVARAAEPGFTPILDGTQASFAQWKQAGPGSFSLQPNGAVRTSGGLGMLWYPKNYGDAIFKLQYRDARTTAGFSNGGIMVRFPGEQICTPLLPAEPACTTPTPTAARPTNWSYDWAGMPGPFPPPQTYANDPVSGDASHGLRAYCSRIGPADTAPAWVAVYCGNEVQVNDSPDGGTLDPIKTGSVYNMADLDATSGFGGSGAQARLDADAANGWTVGQPRAWHDLEIRLIGQQYTVLIDGQVVNQYDNAIPLQPKRSNDPPSQGRQFAAGAFGLQNHGGGDVIEYRDVRVKEVTRPPVNSEAPTVAGSGSVGRPLTCTPGEWSNVQGRQSDHLSFQWFRSNDAPQGVGALAPTEVQYGHELVGTGRQYTPTAADAAAGKVVWCRVTMSTDEGTAWATGEAPPIG